MPRKAAAATQIEPSGDRIAEILAGKRPQKVAPEEFKALLSDYKNHAGTKVYTYRVDPPINQKVVGIEGSNINISQTPYPDDLRAWLKAMHGGGKYELKFNDHNLDYAPIAVTYIEVPLSECDPILDVRVLVRGKPHVEQLIQKWVNEKKCFLDANGQAQPLTGAGAQELHVHQPNPADAVTHDVMSYGLKKALDMAMEKDNPLDLMRAMKEMGGGSDSMLMFMMQLQKQQHEMNMMMMQRMFADKPAERNAFADMEAAIAFAERLRKIGGGRAPAPEPQTWMDKVAPFVPALAPAIDSIAQRLMGGEAQPAKPAQVQPSPEAVQMERMRAANQQIARIIHNCYRNDQDGGDMATAVELLFGQEGYAALCDLGADGIKKDLQVYAPEAWAQLNQPRLDQLLSQFIHAYDDEPAEPEPAHA